MFIQSVDRPDVNGVAPKMQAIADKAREKVDGLVPFMRVSTDDNIMSSVSVRGSFDGPESWSNKIFENSRYFRFSIVPAKGARYYEGGNVKVELSVKSHKIDRKFRAYTGAPDKVIEKIVKWISEGA